MARDADIVVVGAGIVGAATARALADSVATVVLLERFELGHDRGSSHGSSRIFRLNYPDERYVRMAQAAGEAWREFEREREQTLVERIGSLDLGPVAAKTARALAACGVRFETLSADVVRSRWPVRLDDGETAVYQVDGGILLADRAHEALVATAAEAGAEIREHAPVRSLALERRRVRVVLDAEEISTRAVVVTAGAWAPRLLADVGVELPVVPTRETVLYLGLDGAGAHAVGDRLRPDAQPWGGHHPGRPGGLRADVARCRAQGRPSSFRAGRRPGRRADARFGRGGVGRVVGGVALRGPRRRRRDGDMPVHEHRGRGVRARAPRPRRGRRSVLRPRVQVRPRRRPNARRARARGGVLISEQFACTMRA